MEYVFASIGIVIIIALAIVIFIRATKKKSVEALPSVAPLSNENMLQEMPIRLETLSIDCVLDETALVEITDNKVVARVCDLVPELVQVGNSIKDVAQAVQQKGQVLYKAVIPAGAKLADSKDMSGAVRGIYHDAKGIAGHADLVPQAQKGGEVVKNTAAAAANVAAMVVGQYYMSKIDAELSAISDGISQISDFQNNEYHSKIFSLASHIKKITDFQVEILENEELRLSKITQLDDLEEKCTQLLAQANLTLTNYAQRSNIDYAAYEKDLPEVQKWCMYQNTLLELLCKISDLKYALHLGAVSRELCSTLLPTYLLQTKEAKMQLASWHKETAERLEIDAAETRRKRDGLDGALHFIPGLFNDDFNFRTISQSTVQLIQAQSDVSATTYEQSTSDLYSEDVQLIVKDGKLYYLPTK